MNNNAAMLVGRIDRIKTTFQKFTEVKVLAYGETFWWSEGRVRAFQVLAHNASDEEFEELKKNVTIFSGPEMDHKMILRRDGKFENEFEPGFYDAMANMAFEIF